MPLLELVEKLANVHFMVFGLVGPNFFRRFLHFPLFFDCFNWGLWGFNHSKMAKIRFLIDSNTFWMILGTLEISDFLDL